jgi:hypothetical protein
MKRLLILGNGKSRFEYDDYVKSWTGPIWGCNSVYKEYLNGNLPRLDLLIGDYVALNEAINHLKNLPKHMEMLGKNLRSANLPRVKTIDLENKYINDSGTTLVVLALTRGFDEINLLGFDLGGKDIYISNHDQRNKSIWVRNWRMISKVFGLNKVNFIGKNHKIFIMSDEKDDFYAKKYMKGEDHLV